MARFSYREFIDWRAVRLMIVNITTVSGTDFGWTFAYKVAPAGAAIDITGCTLQMQVRPTAEDVTVSVNLSSNISIGGITITAPATLGLFVIRITRHQLDLLTARDYKQALTITWPDGHTDEIWHGTLSHTIGATR